MTEGVSYDTVTYQYDPRGNITEKTYSLNGETVDTVPYTYGNQDGVWADVLTSFDGNNISYDQIGNPLNWTNGETLTWKHGRQLASYTLGDTAITYAYNQDGIRTSKTVNGTTTQYTVTDGTLRRMTSGENTLEFINGTSVIFNDTEYWYVFNAQNDVIGIIDANGNYVVEYTYDAWGAPLSKSGSLADTLGTLNPFRYRGYIYDEETGWYYCQSRYYDPCVGRWVNCDSEIAGIGNIQGYNTFVYCFNNPLNMTDSTGEWPFFAITAAIGAAIGAAVGGISAACSGGDVWSGILGGAAVGGLVGAGLGAAAGAALAGSATASTTSVIMGGKALMSVVETVGFTAGAKMIADNVSQAFTQTSQVFWSGGDVAKDAANQFAKDVGGKTLEMTRLGSYLETIDASYSAWQAASSNFANVATNINSAIYSIQNVAGVNLQSTWATIEYPILSGQNIVYGVAQNGTITIMF